MRLIHAPVPHRAMSIAATVAIHLTVAALALFTWSKPAARVAAERLSTFTVSAAAPPEHAPPEPVQPPEATTPPPPMIDRPVPIVPTVASQPAAAPIVVPMPIAPPAPKPTVAPPAPSAPKPTVAPPAPAAPQRQASAPDVDWQSRLLAHIDRQKRYPRMVGSRRPKGVAIILFRMNRAGAILFARIERSSGHGVLDRAALDTLQRAAPLPPLPDDSPNELQLSVPVAFVAP